MSSRRLAATIAGIGLLLTTLFWSQPVKAAGSVTVAPAFLRQSVSASRPESIATVTVKNDYQVPVAFTVALSDVDQSAGSLVPTNNIDYPLRTLVEITPQSFTLEPGKAINVAVKILNGDTLGPGGHYAAVVVRQVSQSETISDVPLEPAISVALFVTKEDGAVRDVQARLSDLPRFTVSLPKMHTVTFTTQGNIDVVPSAEVSLVRTVSTNVYAKGVVNDAAVPIFPGSELKLQTNLTTIKSPKWPGRYAWLLRARYQGSEAVVETAYWFWYIPIWFIASTAALLIIAPILSWRLWRYWRLRKQPKLPLGLARHKLFLQRLRRRSVKMPDKSESKSITEQMTDITSEKELADNTASNTKRQVPISSQKLQPKRGTVPKKAGLDVIGTPRHSRVLKSQPKPSGDNQE